MKHRLFVLLTLGAVPLACGRAGLEDDVFGGGGIAGSGATGGTGAGGTGAGGTGATGGVGGTGAGGAGGVGAGGFGGTGAGGFGGGGFGGTGAGGFGGGGFGGGGFGGTGGGPQGNCCFATAAPGCTQPGVADCVCKTDPFCCQQSWDDICVGEVESLNCGTCGGTGGFGGGGTGGIGGFGGGGSGGIGGFGGGGSGGIGGFGGGGSGGIGGFGGSGGTGGGPQGDCCVPTSAPGCTKPAVAQCVCQVDSFCCQFSWDQLCVDEVTSLGCGSCGTGGSGGTGGAGGTGGIGGAGGTGGIGGSGGVGGVGGSGGLPPICGDGILQAGEQCDLGPANEDRPALRIVRGNVSSAVVPLDTNQTVQSFYNYSSASSHTGFEAAFGSRAMLHRDFGTGVLSLVMVHGIDLDSSGQFQPAAQVQMSLTGLPTVTIVTVADDTLTEFNKTSATTAAGNWQFQQNSDGGAISQLPFPGNWQIAVQASFSGAITNWAFVNGNKQQIALGGNSNSPLFITALDSPSKCRTSCTIPKCGDGILDGGEVCDDGNVVPNDGCSPDCKALQ